MATNTFRPWFLFGALLAGSAAGTGCIPGPGPDPDPVTPTATVTGMVEIDSGIWGATVYLDENNDNIFEGYEPHATTRVDGTFTLTWDNPGPSYAKTIGAIVTPESTRAGDPGHAAVVYNLHMRAPLGDTSGAYAGTAVISPLTTLVVAEMESDPSLTKDTAAAKITASLTASQLPFSSQPFDVMADYATDYAAGTPTSANSLQLRYVASAVATIVSTTAAEVNDAQSLIDANDSSYSDPAIIAMNKQLTNIANGTYVFEQMTPAERADVQHNPGNSPGLFVDSSTLADDFEDELIAMLLDLAAELFDAFKEEFVSTMEEALTEMVVDQLIDIVL